MAAQFSKRFWTAVETEELSGGFGIALDGRPVKTPAKARLMVPTKALAEHVAGEWDAQTDRIDPAQMPMTRLANSAIDKVTVQKTEIVEMLAAYGDSDLLCYRADAPSELVALQAENWDPLLDWAAEELQVRLAPRTGVIHQTQGAEVIEQLTKLTAEFDEFQLAGFHDLVALSGSIVIGFAAARKHMSVADLWPISRVDENWQISQWGEDEDEAGKVAVKFRAFCDSAAFFEMSG